MTHQITIRPDPPNPEPLTVPPFVEVDKEDVIEWSAEGNKFGVSFHEQRTPVEWATRVSNNGQPFTGTVRKDAKPGAYKYAPSVTNSAGDLFVVGSPFIIVR